MQTKNPIFDEAAKFVTGAMGAAQAAGDEAKGLLRSQTDRVIADMDLVSREEYEVLKEMFQASQARIEALETKLELLTKHLNKD
ncbi:accessory factor UbiK family protein [Hirschia maritima]|uniref:accessory factor UbiK family protein n=1 Tax=Hirschia maritima TaxID=1121961 RepID=UPI0003796A30|nr:accessory factor UbiK family protein [Hirschia maritima]